MDVRKFIVSTPAESFDAITVYFSLIGNITQGEIKQFITGFYALLKPGGLLVFATVPISLENVQSKWMGRTVQMSSLGPEETVEAVKMAGFQIVHETVMRFTPKAVEAGICNAGDVFEESHMFVYAKKPASL
jgi:hypothetical protein